VPTDQRDRIMHTQLTVGDIVLMGADAPPDLFETLQGFYMNLQFDTIAEVERVFTPYQKTERYGCLSRKPFGQTVNSLEFGKRYTLGGS
jgi:PhnB protein